MWFSLIADEATDISRNEQLCVSIRWVDRHYNINEYPLGLVQLPNAEALTIFDTIKDVLIRCSLPLSQCRGQAFDGAANMSGLHNSVQGLVKREESKALYVHCLAHSLNLCVQEVTKQCVLLRDVLQYSLPRYIYELIHNFRGNVVPLLKPIFHTNVIFC